MKTYAVRSAIRHAGEAPGRRSLTLLVLIVAGLLSALCGGARSAEARGAVPPKPPQGGAIAADPTLKVIYLAQPISNNVFVLSADGSTVLGVLQVPPSPMGLAIDTRAHLLYVASGQAGVVTVFDEYTRHVKRVLPIGGRPAGLILGDKGHRLLVTDSASGIVRGISLAAKPIPPTQILDLGPGADLSAILVPGSAPRGARVVIWGRGFAPGERVEAYWGLKPLAGIRADDAGMVLTHFPVPRKAQLGRQLIVLIGQHTTHSESALLTVIKPPPPPKPAPVVKPVPKPLLQRLLAPRLVLVVPSAVGVGPLKSLSGTHKGIVLPAFGLEAAVALLGLGLILRMKRRRKRRVRSGKEAGGMGAADPARTLKGAA
ncbi:MAG: YncE family protein [Chloroflexota bacterium]